MEGWKCEVDGGMDEKEAVEDGMGGMDACRRQW